VGSVTENGDTASTSIIVKYGNYTLPVGITMYRNHNGTWLVCQSALADVDQNR
jgi:hypothetical protein